MTSERQSSVLAEGSTVELGAAPRSRAREHGLPRATEGECGIEQLNFTIHRLRTRKQAFQKSPKSQNRTFGRSGTPMAASDSKRRLGASALGRDAAASLDGPGKTQSGPGRSVIWREVVRTCGRTGGRPKAADPIAGRGDTSLDSAWAVGQSGRCPAASVRCGEGPRGGYAEAGFACSSAIRPRTRARSAGSDVRSRSFVNRSIFIWRRSGCMAGPRNCDRARDHVARSADFTPTGRATPPTPRATTVSDATARGP